MKRVVGEMVKISVTMLLLLFWMPLAGAQVIVGNYQITYVSVAPTGACFQSAPLRFVVPSGILYGCQNGTWAIISGGGGGTGTVTSVTFTGDGTVLSATPSSAVTTSGTVTAALANAAANTVLAGPPSGGAAAPTYQTAPTISAANLTNFPTLNQNTSGTASNLSGTPALPNGVTATTQAATDNSTKLATTAFVVANNPANTCNFLNGCVQLLLASDGGGFNGIGGSMGALNSCTAIAIAPTSTSPQMSQCTAVTTAWVAGWLPSSSFSRYYVGRQPKLTFLVAYNTATDYTTNARIQLGFLGTSCSVATMNASDTPACTYAIIRSSTAASDAAYQCVSDTGSGTPTVTSIAVVPTTTATTMSISFGSGSVTCTVAGTSVTNNTKVPASSILLLEFFSNSGLSSNAVHLQIGGMFGISQNGNF